MADYDVPAGHVGVHEKAATADEVDTVRYLAGAPGTQWGRMPRAVEIVSNGAAAMYVTVDGSQPVVGGTNCYAIPPFPGATVIDVHDTSPDDEVVVKLVSPGTPTYWVSRAK